MRVVLQIASVAILARLLSPEHFGLFAMAGAVTALVGVLTEINMSAAAVQRSDLTQSAASGMLVFIVGMAFATLALSVACVPIATWIFNDSRLGPVVFWLAAAAPVSALGSMHHSLLARNMRWLDIQIVSLGGFTIGVIVAVAAAVLLNVGYWALVVQAWATSLATTGLAWIRCPWRPTRVREWSSARASLGFGLNLSGAMILNYVNRQLDNVLIGWRWGSTELGFYARAYALMQAPLSFITGPVSSTLIPALSRLQHEPEKWSKAYLEAFGAVMIANGAMACLLYGGARVIVEIVLGPGWDSSAEIFSNLAIAMLAAGPMRTTGWIYLSLGRTDRMLQWSLLATPVYVLSFVIGLPFGGSGVALSFGIAQLLAFVPCMWMAIRGTSLTLGQVFKVATPPTLIAVVVGVSLHILAGQLNMVWSIVALVGAAAVYFAAMSSVIAVAQPYRDLRTRLLITLGAIRNWLAVAGGA